MTSRTFGRLALEYAVAMASLAVFVGLRLALDPILGDVAPLIFFLLPVAFSAWFGGFGPGIVATTVATFVGVAIFTSAGRGSAGHPIAFFWFARGLPFFTVGTIISLFAARLEAARADARRGDELQRQIFESVKDFSIFTTDLAGRVATWSVGAQRLFGYATTDAIGMSVREMFTPEDRDAGVAEAELSRAAREGSASDDRWHVRKDGSRFFASGALTVLRDRRGTHVGFTKVSRDVTERRAVEQERERQLASELALRHAAEQTGRMKDEFLATISHELRTPLSAIVGWSDLLSSGRRRDAATIEEGLDVIRRNAHAQSRLIEDILDMSRITSGKVRLNICRLDVREPIRSAIKTVESAARAKAITIVDALGDAPAYVSADPDRLQQVFWNLLANAIKFSAAQRPIIVELRVDGARVRASVIDRGNGIAAEFLPYLFERFRQVDMSSTRRYGGLGLGLSIVKHLVELHGGTVGVASDGVGKGSTFDVEIPLAANRDDVASTGEVASVAANGGEASASSVRLGGLRVLVVDDHADARRVFQAALAEQGIEATMVASAAEGLAALASQRFDAVLSDIGMPDVDGYGFLSRVREIESATNERRVPMIAVTAFARPADRQAVLSAGFDDYLAKPVQPAALLATLASVIESSRIAAEGVVRS